MQVFTTVFDIRALRSTLHSSILFIGTDIHLTHIHPVCQQVVIRGVFALQESWLWLFVNEE